MIWVLIIFGLVIFGSLIYKKRFTSKRQIDGLYTVQFYYLAIIAPAISVCLINLALEVLSRPRASILPIPEIIIYSFYVISVIIGAIGSGIHSTSTSVYQTFFREHKVGAFYVNEKFHGALSHYMLYLSSIGCAFFLSLLELNHPMIVTSLNPGILALIGICLGLLTTLSVTWSRYIMINLVTAFLAIAILSQFLSLFKPIENYPVFIVASTFLGTLTLGLALINLCFQSSIRLKRRLILTLFPKGHPLKEIYS